MTERDDPNTSGNEPESIYKAPTSDTRFAPGGDSLAVYVGPKNADYYARIFDQLKSGGGISWHWPAFFISSFWLLYRKMWLNALLYWIVLPIVLIIIATAIAMATNPNAYFVSYYSMYFVIGFLILPMFANRLYYRHAQSKVNKVASITSSPDQQSAELARIGGTSKVIFVVLPLVLIMVIGILAAIAIPAYQDYTIRAQVSEGLNLSGGAKAAVTEYFGDYGSFPTANQDAGVASSQQISGKYVASVEVDRGEIVITYGNEAHTVISGHSIILSPEAKSANLVDWKCASPSIAPKHLPAACR